MTVIVETVELGAIRLETGSGVGIVSSSQNGPLVTSPFAIPSALNPFRCTYQSLPSAVLVRGRVLEFQEVSPPIKVYDTF